MPFTVTMPKLSPTMVEGAIAKWNKKEGEFIHAGELLVEIATDKATLEFTAFDEGWVRQLLAREGQICPVGAPIAVCTAQADESLAEYQPEGIQFVPEVTKATTAVPCAETGVLPAPPILTGPVHVPEPPHIDNDFPYPVRERRQPKASPLARRLAQERGLDLSTVKGSGPGGRIVEADLAHAQPERLVTFGRCDAPSCAPGSYHEEPLTLMRKTLAHRLQESKSFIPHFYVQQQIVADALIALRQQLLAADLKISYNDLIIRAVALALRQHRDINVGFNSVTQHHIIFESIDISVAVSVEGGLLTPILWHADFKNVGQIAQEMKELTSLARAGRLQPCQYKGGSFCVSNLGMMGITGFTAVINPPQAAILAVGAIESQPIVRDGSVVVGNTLLLTLSADHRVIDGSSAAAFMKTLQRLLESPALLVIN